MDVAARTNACTLKANNILIVLSSLEDEGLAQEFFGSVITANDIASGLPSFAQKTVYLCGDISKVKSLELDLKTAERVLIIKQHSHGYDEAEDSEIWAID